MTPPETRSGRAPWPFEGPLAICAALDSTAGIRGDIPIGDELDAGPRSGRASKSVQQLARARAGATVNAVEADGREAQFGAAARASSWRLRRR